MRRGPERFVQDPRAWGARGPSGGNTDDAEYDDVVMAGVDGLGRDLLILSEDAVVTALALMLHSKSLVEIPVEQLGYSIVNHSVACV